MVLARDLTGTINLPFRSIRHFVLWSSIIETTPQTRRRPSLPTLPAKLNMSMWNRLRQTFQRNRDWLNGGNVSNEIVKFAVAMSIPWALTDGTTAQSQSSATFKELHQPRTISYSEDDNASAGWH